MTGDVTYAWRGSFESAEANALHAAAFETQVFSTEEWDWLNQVRRHSLGWVTARRGADLVGFVNVISDGFVHAWIQDVMVARAARGAGVGVELVRRAADGARRAGCEWLHVDFDDDLEPFYIDACGFTPSRAGLLELS
ncbi:MAG: GNAT family N-acetyltransferase [Actinomycetota bacterium]